AFRFDSVSFENATVLVVDDVSSNLVLLEEWLTLVNVEALLAQDGKKAVESAMKNTPALIFMDLWMPEMDGFKAAEILKKNPRTKDIPIVALTGSTSDETRAKLLPLGFSGYLPKPVNIRDFFHILSQKLKPDAIQNPACPLPTPPHDSCCTAFVLNPEELAESLEKDIIPAWRDVKDALVIYKIIDFSTNLKKVAEKHNLQTLIDFAASLHDYAEELDVINIGESLQLFPELLKELTGIEIKE
ncbi:MAG: response regulator, partial [bacterium]|nr:response regulator [bacterium]